MSASAKTRLLLAAILLAALLVRLVGVANGLPNAQQLASFHPDERFIVHHAGRMVATGDLHPKVFTYPGLVFYVDAAVFWVGTQLGWLGSLYGYHLAARLVTVLFGTASVFLAYLLGRELRDGATGCLAAAFLAFLPGAVEHSQFGTVDVPSACFGLAAVLCAVRVLARPQWRWVLLGGAASGLAAATKYPAGLSLLSVLLAVALARRGLGRAAAATGASLLAFLVTNPFIVLDFPMFWTYFRVHLDLAGQGLGLLFVETGNGFAYLLLHNLGFAMGLPAALLATVAALWLAWRHRPRDLVVLAFLVPTVLLYGLGAMRFLRYTMPMLPLLSVAVAELAVVAWRESPARGPAVARAVRGLLVVLLAWPVALTLRQAVALADVDPRLQGLAWLEQHAGREASIGLPAIPNIWTVPLSPFNAGPETRELFALAQQQGTGRFKLVICDRGSVEELARTRPDYFVLSEFEWREELRLRDAVERIDHPQLREQVLAMNRLLDVLAHDFTVVATFDNFPAWQRMFFSPVFAPHDWLYPFPQVRIYRRRAG